MGRYSNDGCLMYIGFVLFVSFGIPFLSFIFSPNIVIYSIPSILVIVFVVWFVYRYNDKSKELRDARNTINKQYDKINKISKDLKDAQDTIVYKNILLDKQLKKEESLKGLLNSANPFKYVSSLYVDAELSIFDEEYFNLKYKDRPATKASETVKYLKSQSKSYIQQYKEMLYKYEFLLKSFPELEKYVDDYESLKIISDCKTYSELEEGFDRVSDYISKEEWMRMSVNERNQLALDRYKEREKSNWVIGIEYEMYIDHILRSAGFSTIQFGIKEGLNDLGRDIIAKKNGKYYIIQCKNWSRKKEIHENVVCQLFGTTLEYKIEKAQRVRDIDWDKRVFPVLYTTTSLSETAMKFSEKLGVVVVVKEKGEYPMIKCNIGNNREKIYHLPFDQQYYKVVIEEEKGECYAWTVEEAVSKGFRRAYRFNGYSN